MSYDKKVYLKLLSKDKFYEVNNYRVHNMPKSLFKYIGLNEPNCGQIKGICKKDFKLNELKFDSLEQNKLWLSTFDNLNDPFEYKSLFLDIKKLQEYKWLLNLLNQFLGV